MDRHPRLEVRDRRGAGGYGRARITACAAWGALAFAAGYTARTLRSRDPDWRRVVQDAPEGFVAFDERGRVIEWNRACEEMFGFSREEALGWGLSDLVVPDRMRATYDRALARYRETGVTPLIGRPLVVPALRSDGVELTVEFTLAVAPVRGRRFFYAFIHDATDHRRTERYLEAQSEVARVLLEGHSLRGAGPELLAALGDALGWDAGALWLADEHEGVLRCASTWSADRQILRPFLSGARRLVLGPGEGLAGRVWQTVEPQWLDTPDAIQSMSAGSPEHLAQIRAALALPLHSQGKALGVLEFLHTSPYRRDDELLQLTTFIALHIAGYLDQLRGTDLLERSRTVARTDELTGLPNRRALNEDLPARLDEVRDSERVLCLAMIDLDNFKAFNDVNGHPAGDRLLRRSAAAWRAQLRDGDLLARYGGEEFTVILEAPMPRAQEILERMRAATPSEQTCSVGLTEWDGHESPESLIARADDALYRAKHLGRDRIELARTTVA